MPLELNYREGERNALGSSHPRTRPPTTSPVCAAKVLQHNCNQWLSHELLMSWLIFGLLCIAPEGKPIQIHVLRPETASLPAAH